jgi:hypothetical protein
VKWEAQQTQMGPGLRPYVYHDYPMMLHKAGRPDNGLGADLIVDTRVVDSESEEEQARHQGFRRTPLEALEGYKGEQLEFAKLAAEIEYEKKKKLSPAAIAEVEAAQEAHPGHMPSVPVTSIAPRKRGRPAKVRE